MSLGAVYYLKWKLRTAQKCSDTEGRIWPTGHWLPRSMRTWLENWFIIIGVLLIDQQGYPPLTHLLPPPTSTDTYTLAFTLTPHTLRRLSLIEHIRAAPGTGDWTPIASPLIQQSSRIGKSLLKGSLHNNLSQNLSDLRGRYSCKFCIPSRDFGSNTGKKDLQAFRKYCDSLNLCQSSAWNCALWKGWVCYQCILL